MIPFLPICLELLSRSILCGEDAMEIQEQIRSGSCDYPDGSTDHEEEDHMRDQEDYSKEWALRFFALTLGILG